MSRTAFANGFFRHRFSSSSVRSRQASDAVIPPYQAIQSYCGASLIPCLRYSSVALIPPVQPQILDDLLFWAIVVWPVELAWVAQPATQ